MERKRKGKDSCVNIVVPEEGIESHVRTSANYSWRQYYQRTEKITSWTVLIKICNNSDVNQIAYFLAHWPLTRSQQSSFFLTRNTRYLMPLLSSGSSCCPWASTLKTVILSAVGRYSCFSLFLPGAQVVPLDLFWLLVLNSRWADFLDDVPLWNTCPALLMLSSTAWMRST